MISTNYDATSQLQALHSFLCESQADLTDKQKHGTYHKTDSYFPGDRGFHRWSPCYPDRKP